MKKYNVFNLYVVEKDGYKFICEKIFDKEYKEVLTKERLVLEEKNKVKFLIDYYSIFEIAVFAKNLEVDKALMLSKKDILLKYIEINEKVKNKDFNVYEFLNKQEEDLKGWQILKEEFPELAKQLAVRNLQKNGIIDENKNLIGPYNDILKKVKSAEQMVDMYETYIDSKKDNIPDIPIINAKELQKRKG